MRRHHDDPDDELDEDDEFEDDPEEADADREKTAAKANLGCDSVALLLALSCGGFFLRAWVFCRLWAWFVTPMFGLPGLRYVHGLGLMLLAWLLVPLVSPGKRAADEVVSRVHDLFLDEQERFRLVARKMQNAIFATVFPPLFGLAAGWIIKLFL